MDARPPAWLAKHRGNECRDVYPVHHPVVPFWAGLLSGHLVMIGGHILMLPAMVAAMLLRRDECTGSH